MKNLWKLFQKIKTYETYQTLNFHDKFKWYIALFCSMLLLRSINNKISWAISLKKRSTSLESRENPEETENPFTNIESHNLARM